MFVVILENKTKTFMEVCRAFYTDRIWAKYCQTDTLDLCQIFALLNISV